ncbi:DUF3761 domain-containing protein [Mycobacterium sp. E2989]|uniref:DUF3761 domain-containing protein n=1 Tax=Mycobacterium sp. E2989 TaxID=1834140 RepID=UPI0009ED2AF4|nr:DUF3761 domain-containing protein [Mycobacterium sp. E2989]
MLSRAAFIAAAVATAAIGLASPSSSECYINVDGTCVPNPTSAPAPPPGATAQCRDGTYSSSTHRSGTCSSHGGVLRWL